MKPGLLQHFDEQARGSAEYGSPFTGALIAALAEDIRRGGPTALLVADWPGHARADALSLRLTGALHSAVLTGAAPALAAQYPAQRSDWRIEEVWPAARQYLVEAHDEVARFITSAPQTNETRRSIGLLAGFLDVARAHPGLPLDTLEIGASAGLNLHWDRFHYDTGRWTWGTPGPVTIDTDWRGPPPALDAAVRVRHRAACDLNPLDVRKPEDRVRLKSYIWPDQPERLARFEGAVALALAAEVQVERADAAAWLERKLAERAPDAVTVVYHSIFYQYPPPEVRKRIAEVIAAAGEASPAPLIWLRLEPEPVLGGPRESLRTLIDTITWPGAARRTLAETDGHVRYVEVL
jgi:hypothetical protein